MASLTPHDVLVWCGAMSVNLHFGTDLLDPADPRLHAVVGDGVVVFTRRPLKVGWADMGEHGAWLMARRDDGWEFGHYVRGQLCHVERGGM